MRNILFISLLLFLHSFPLFGESLPPLNSLILHYQKSMPQGGGYTEDALAQSILSDGKNLLVTPKTAQPSYCSSATYLVFLQTINELIQQNALKLKATQLKALCFHDEPDGEGIWGRWNANGPGVAKLFADLKIGTNFEDIEQAKPGDFMKIFWNEHIGKRERGHLVIYLGHFSDKSGKQWVKFWSSNQPNGYGSKSVPITNINWAIFSRLDHWKNLPRISQLPKSDPFLTNMLHKDFTRDQVRNACKIIGKTSSLPFYKSQ